MSRAPLPLPTGAFLAQPAQRIAAIGADAIARDPGVTPMRRLRATLLILLPVMAIFASACAERVSPPSTEPPTPSGPVVNPPPAGNGG